MCILSRKITFFLYCDKLKGGIIFYVIKHVGMKNLFIKTCRFNFSYNKMVLSLLASKK